MSKISEQKKSLDLVHQEWDRGRPRNMQRTRRYAVRSSYPQQMTLFTDSQVVQAAAP